MSKILIVEDRKMVRKAMSEMLKLNGYTDLRTAEAGGEALEIFQDQNPDLVLLDIILPDMNGLEIAKKMIDIAPDVKIIAVTAIARDEIESECLDAGCIKIVHKPFRMVEMIRSIGKILGSN
ncbi:MAG: response regulator [Candidatus Thermoplasmatota archaeon]|nr:response regulator [Candidatus Thermoplasmatota archaeon]